MVYRPPDIIAPGLRKFTKEGIWTHRQVQHDHTIVASLAKTGVGEPSHIRPKKEIDKLRGSCFVKKTRNQIAHCKRSIGLSGEGNLRAVGQPRLNSIRAVNSGHDPRDTVADDAQDGEWIRAIEDGLTKILGGGVMRGEIGFCQAGSPKGFEGAGRLAVQNLKRRTCRDSRGQRSRRPVPRLSSHRTSRRRGRHYRP